MWHWLFYCNDIRSKNRCIFSRFAGSVINVMYNCRSWNIHDSSSLFDFLSISLSSVWLWIFSIYLKYVDLLYIHVCVPYHLNVFPRYTTLHNGFEPVTKWKLFTTHGLSNLKERGQLMVVLAHHNFFLWGIFTVSLRYT